MTGVRRLPHAQVVELVGRRPPDRAIAGLAARQHGVVATRQLVALGLTQQAVSRRAASGRLHRVHRGVYASGHPVLGVRGRWMAAVLACGDGAVLSHASAGALWGLRRSDAAHPDVTVPRPGGHARPRVCVHRAPGLAATEVTVRDRIPLTTAARTILDLAARLPSAYLEQVLNQAELRELTDHRSLAAVVNAHPGHRGAGRLARALAAHRAGADVTRSDLEILFRQLCADHGLPMPRSNARIADLEVDALFVEHGLVVEIDSWRYHRGRRAFEADRARDAVLARAGHRTLRFTDRQLTEQPATVVATLRVQLSAPRSSA